MRVTQFKCAPFPDWHSERLCAADAAIHTSLTFGTRNADLMYRKKRGEKNQKHTQVMKSRKSTPIRA